MKPIARGRRPGSKNYTKAFRETVVAEANDPNRSIAEVARTHGLNANMVAQWRRSSLEAQRTTPASCVALLPVDVIDLHGEDAGNHVAPQDREVTVRPATPTGCEIEIEIGKRRVRIRGLSMDRAEQFLRDCLK
ncbi:MAG TPA: transposase [Paraburkholderia sp.]|nr:transposase [Paraburkholderia sp.]